MDRIEDNDFNYYRKSDILIGVGSSDPTATNKHMNKSILIAVPVSLLAVAALVLSFASLSAETLIGFASVLGLLGVAALEYRISWKRLFGRS